ncbi:hypothetical protein MRB53_002500 [Persea americana]|uniref:Uncharacterized protein n=1 Tax=Persea americana TaxID=3435 RepID=A0ACC2MUP7_PERAE|nr:hypothetical protein MRB53_002500 [Persea americana]
MVIRFHLQHCGRNGNSSNTCGSGFSSPCEDEGLVWSDEGRTRGREGIGRESRRKSAVGGCLLAAILRWSVLMVLRFLSRATCIDFSVRKWRKRSGGEGDEEEGFRVHPIGLFVELNYLSHSTHWECRAEKSHMKPKQAGRSTRSLVGSEDRGGGAGLEDRVVYPLHVLLLRCRVAGLGKEMEKERVPED